MHGYGIFFIAIIKWDCLAVSMAEGPLPNGKITFGFERGFTCDVREDTHENDAMFMGKEHTIVFGTTRFVIFCQ